MMYKSNLAIIRTIIAKSGEVGAIRTGLGWEMKRQPTQVSVHHRRNL
jgi:hypothetical protein